nr:keratinocyte proline-rich protein-like isoform X1 [Osmia lignaria]
MFSRAAKSIVKTISQRKYHVGDENKLAMIGGTGGISRSLSQMLKQTSKLDVLALYDVASLNKRFTSIPNRLHNLNIGEPINSEKPTLFSMLEKSQSSRGNIEPVETQELIENLRRLPLAEESAAEQIMKTDRMGSQLQPTPGSLNRHQHQNDKVFEGKHEDRTESLGNLRRFSKATLRNCLRAKSQYCLGSSFGNYSGNTWNWACSSILHNPGLVSARNFGTRSNVVWLSNELTNYIKQEQTRFLQTTSNLMGKGKKKPPSTRPPKSPGSSNQRRGPCRQPSERQKPCPPMEKCIPPAPPCCRRRPVNPKCPDRPRPPCPPPCPTPCPKPPEKPPPPKICYRKCPPPPKLPRLPRPPKIPAPPPPPPPPKIPKPPRCPPPCPPPPAPPLPKCPRAPKCPECPPQKECPPPPPCEPCPCPLPCPPPCCPPPPPCPPCPPPIPCPKPLPCPPPPAPRACPPCPPCAECPEPPPCPPPPPCCPCPCPKPPPPCPCPKPCPPCKKAAKPTKCPDDVPSCPKCPKRNPKKRKMSTYQVISRFLPLRNQYRKLHVSTMLLKKSDKSSCENVGDICQGDKSNTCAKSCRRDDCGKKRQKCSDQSKKMQKKKWKKKKRKKKKKEDCIQTCIPIGKCQIPQFTKPPKMEYGPAKCPAPKFASPKPCPEPPEQEPCVEVRTLAKPKEICPPLPLPKPPTDPVVLCPCPPPPKMHPGPCPCYDTKKEKKEQSKPVKPCNVREKYVCPLEAHYCPQDKQDCKRQKPCDSKRSEKKKKKKP